MKVYLISNNLVLENIVYETDETLEQKRINRPLSIMGEKKAMDLAKKVNVQIIYSSFYASALATAKYLRSKNDVVISINSNLKDAVIGELGSKNIKNLRLMQEKDFNYRYINGESLNDTKLRMKKIMQKIISSSDGDVAVVTHKRAIMSYLLDYTEKGYNLDDRLILSFKEKVIIDDAENDMNVIVITVEDGQIIDIDHIEGGE